MSKTESERAQLRSFTGDKLDWLSALSGDPRLDARAFEVGFQIAQHVNAQTGVAILSDDTISDKTGIPKRWVLRVRNALRSAGWINWKRTKTANIYWTLGGQINQVTDRQIVLREMRQERRLKLRNAQQETPPVAYLKLQETPPVALPETPPVALPETPPVANIHLSRNTLDLTPSKISPPVEDPLLGIEGPAAEMWLLTELGGGDAALGNQIADAIGSRRFLTLLDALTNGSLYRSQIQSASDFAIARRNVDAA
ncbi:hypothetical protein ACVIIW_006253 [Bradyrhizobium sp. USDA 4449]